jgi:hypothetical protein
MLGLSEMDACATPMGSKMLLKNLFLHKVDPAGVRIIDFEKVLIVKNLSVSHAESNITG